MSVSNDLEWLSRWTAEYHEFGKLGRGFSSMDDLEKVYICDGVIPRPTYVSARLKNKPKTGNN
jgi:hypothetical protein